MYTDISSSLFQLFGNWAFWLLISLFFWQNKATISSLTELGFICGILSTTLSKLIENYTVSMLELHGEDKAELGGIPDVVWEWNVCRVQRFQLSKLDTFHYYEAILFVALAVTQYLRFPRTKLSIYSSNPLEQFRLSGCKHHTAPPEYPCSHDLHSLP